MPNRKITHYPLTKAQKSILIIEEFYSGTTFVNVCGTVRIREKLDYSLLNKALNLILERNEALRSRIIEGREVKQYFAPFKEQDYDLIDFSIEQTDFYRWEKKVSRIPFSFYDSDLFYFAMLKFSDSEGGFYVKCHHINLDAWSIVLLSNQVLQYYCSLRDGIFPQDTDRKSFIDHIRDEEKYLNSFRFEKDKKYWGEIIARIKDPNIFSWKKTYKTAAKRNSQKISLELSKKINQFCQENKVSPFIVFASALAIYYWRIKGKEKVVIGVPFLNRTGIREKNTIGMFINNLPFLIEIEPSLSYLELLYQLSSEWMKVLRHGSYPYVNILKEYRETHEVTGRIYDLALSFQNARYDVKDLDFDSEWHFIEEEVNPLSISINDRENKGIYHLDYDFLIDVLEKEETDALHKGLVNLLKQGLENPDERIEALNLLSQEEEEVIVRQFNRTDLSYPADVNILQLFQEQVKRNPENTALICRGKQLTYREVDEKSDQLAAFLTEKGVRKEDIIALKLHRSLDLIIGIMGVLKAGAAYLPVDPSYPPERISYMLADSKCRYLITNQDGRQATRLSGVEEINLNNAQIWQKRAKAEIRILPSDLAYVIYTSGSTGQPKGVMIQHQALASFVHAIVPAVGLSSYKSIIALTTISFDIFFVETILPLLLGMKIIIADDTEHNDPSAVLSLIKEHRVDVLQVTPTRMKTILAENSCSASLAGLSLIMVGGEAFPQPLLADIQKRSAAKIYNMYGPTESTIWSAVKRLDKPDRITIGRPMGNTRIYILDKFLRPLPIGAEGEIYIAGDGLAKGYLNKPGLTGQKFGSSPFIPDERIYQTGDIGRWLPDGEIEYIGRNDCQVKIRGFRIEMGEIERCLLLHESVSEAVVNPVQGKNDRFYLCAYLTGNKATVEELRNHLLRYLPDYMVPARFVWLSSLPLTPNGKINRQALPEPEENIDYLENKYEPPRNTIEKYLTEVWGQVLDISRVGISDDFFSLGGDSLAILEVLSGIVEKDWKITAQDFYEYPTVKQLSSVIEKRMKNKKSIHNTEEITLDVLDVLSGFPGYDLFPVGNIFLTGASGFLGIHILKSFLDTCTGKVFCLVRGEDGQERLNRLLKYYFRDISPEKLSRVTVIKGEITEESLGLSAGDYNMLAEEVSSVIHCAALVKHYGPYSDFERVNVHGTENVINFCTANGKYLSFISTISVSGNYMNSGRKKKVFKESDLYIGQDYKNNVYIRSKFEAEYRVFKAMGSGLKATIFRVGILTGRLSDGLFQYNINENAFYRRLKSIIEIQCFPENAVRDYIEFTPVDSCAEAIIRLLAGGLGKHRVYHMFNHKMVKIRDFLEILKSAGLNVNIVSPGEFAEVINNLAKTESGKEIISGIITDIIVQGGLSFRSNVAVDSSLTVKELAKMNFEWPEITPEYIKNIINHMEEVGFLQKNKEIG